MLATLSRSCLIVVGLFLQACAPSPSELSLQAIAKVADRIAVGMAPSLYKRLDSLGVTTAPNRTIALVFPPGGKPPPNATCAADVRTALERQLRQLAARTRIDFQVVKDVDKAAVVFVVGDTADMLEKGTPPLEDWISKAEQRTSVRTTVAHDNWSTPHSVSDFFEGVFTYGDGRLIFGASFIHWFEMTNRIDRRDCTPNFVQRLTRIYSQILDMDFRDEYAEVGRRARTQIGPSAYEADNRDVANFGDGVLFCAQFVERTKLAACAVEIVKLSSEQRL